MKNFLKFSFLIFLVFTIFFGIQLVRWQQFSLEVSWISLKKLLTGGSVSDDLAMGTICNSLEKFDCSIEAFLKVIQIQPRHRGALANLGIAHSHLNQWAEAKKYFEAYFSLGGEAYDISFWYARLWKQLGDQDKAVEWYYRTLNQNGSFFEGAKELVESLISQKKYYEALSLIAHITDGSPERDVHWGPKVNAISDQIETKGENKEEKIKERSAQVIPSDSFALPSLMGDRFYLPIWLDENSNVHFVLVDESSSLTVPRDFIEGRLVNKILENRMHQNQFNEGDKVEIPRLRLAVWKLEKFKIEICEKCRAHIPKQMLNKFNFKTLDKFGVSFLVFP